MTTLLRVPAIQIRQGTRTIYTAALDGKLLSSIAAISRVRRDDTAVLHGYQRPQAITHIRGIQRYLESSGALLPNAIVLALDERVVFAPATGDDRSQSYAVPGELLVPVDPELPEHECPVWIVDGQQRAAAIRDADVMEFPVAVVAFTAASVAEQRAQFVLVNSTKPLPKGLVHELLPATDVPLPAALERKRAPATLLARLSSDRSGPFHQAIHSPTSPHGWIKDTSVLRMIEHSIREGALYQYRDRATGDVDGDRAHTHLSAFWSAVRDTWPEAWSLAPRHSRLTHGAGITALGYVMEQLTETVPADRLDGDWLRGRLATLRPHTAWTEGTWASLDGRRWDALQNTRQDLALLSRHLLRHLPATSAGGAA